MKLLRFVPLAALFGACLALAQEPAPPKPAQPPPPVTKEQTVYVPFEKLEQVFEKQERGVFLPYREFLELWNKLNLPEKLKTSEPPVDGVLAAANYHGKVTGDLAEVQMKLDFEAFKDGWSRLSLETSDLRIAEAKSAAVLNFADDGYEVLFPKKGSYTLDATVFGKVTRESGRSTLDLALPKTSVSQFEMTIPEQGLEFAITPAAAYSAVENPDGSTKLAVYFGASTEVQISWTKKAGETALQPLLFADAQTEVHMGEGVVRTNVTMNYQILRAGVKALEILVPENQQVLSVNGQDVKEWTVKAEAGTQRLHVDLHNAAKDRYDLSIQLESALPALPQQVKLPLISAQGVERQSGSIGLFAAPEMAAEIGTLEGLTQQAAQTNKETKDTPIGRYHYLRLPYSGTVSLRETKPQVEVASVTLLVITPESQQLTAEFHYTVKKAGIFSAQIELPAGFTQADVASAPEIESSSVQEVGGRHLLNVKFTSRRIGDFTFKVTAEKPRTKPDEAAGVPVFAPQNVDRHEAKVGLAIHKSLKANTVDKGELREEDIRNLSNLPQRETLEAAAATAPLTLGFRYRGVAKPAQIQFELRKPRVSAEVLALSEIHEALIRNVWTVAYNVEYAGVNEFTIEVPNAIADEVEINGANIKERTKTPSTDAQGQPTGTSLWRVILQDKVLGAYELTLSHDTARGEQKQGATTQVLLPEIKPLNVFRETGQVAVIKDGNLEFTKTDARGLELIDPKELHGSLQRDGVFLAYKYSAHPISLSLDVSKNLYLDVPLAVVSHAVLTSVIAEDEAETTEVIYWVRNNAQQFFSIQLPSKAGQPAKLLSDAFVNGEPQQPSKRPDKNEVLIRLPARQNGAESFPVRFVYEVPSPRAGERLWWRGSLDLEPPKLADTGILQTKWTLYLPSDYRYVKFDGAMRETVSRRGWDSLFRGFRWFIPRVGPALTTPENSVSTEPPELPPAKSAGFDTQIQKEGVSVTLRRLDAPAPVRVAYRGKTYAATVEAIFCLLAFIGGIRLIGSPRQARFLYFAVFGLGSLVIAGALNPRAAGLWQAIYLGVFLAALVWIVRGSWNGGWALLRRLAGLFRRKPPGPLPRTKTVPLRRQPNPPPPPRPQPPTGDAPNAPAS